MDFPETPSDGIVGEAIVKLDIVEPTERHTATVIFLHGSGDQGKTFIGYAKQFKMGYIKWILPSAKTRRCTAASGNVLPLWFDIHQARDLSVGPWDEDGILETVTSVHGLIEHEIKVNSIPAERIVVAGLSQGSAMAVWSGLTFTSGKLAGICGIAGRLPAKERLQEMLSPHAAGLSVWLGHGTLDRTVPIEIGSTKVVEFLRDVVGMRAAETVGDSGYEFNIYPNLVHWIGEKQWEDVGRWLSKRLPPVVS